MSGSTNHQMALKVVEIYDSLSGEVDCLKKKGGCIKNVNTTVYSHFLSGIVNMHYQCLSLFQTQTHTHTHSGSASLRNCGQYALQQLLTSEPRYSPLRWEWGGRRKSSRMLSLSPLPTLHIAFLKVRHHRRAWGGHSLSSQ